MMRRAVSSSSSSFIRRGRRRSRRSLHVVAAQGFAADADLYEAVRPSYPAAAVDHLLSRTAAGAQCLDLASGTGKLSRQLADHAKVAELVCAEPVAAMRAACVVPAPVRVVAAHAEDLGAFEDGSLDVVTVGQAFHWFATVTALVEIGRVLRPGGTLGLIWNLEDGATPWVRALRDLYEIYDGDVPQYRKGQWKDAFFNATDVFGEFAHDDEGPKNDDDDDDDDDDVDDDAQTAPGEKNRPWKSAFFDHALLTTKDEIWTRVLSKSYINQQPPPVRAALERDIRRLADDLPLDSIPRQGDGALCVRMPIRTEVFLARKL